MDKIHFSKLWYIGRLKHLEDKLSQIPFLRIGRRGNSTVLRYKRNGKRTEICPASKKWPTYKKLFDTRQSLSEEYNRLLSEYQDYFKEDYFSIRNKYTVIPCKTGLNTDYWNALIDDECPAENHKELYYDGHHFRSRIEMQAAIAVKELGLKYKYDSCVYRNDAVGYTDFAICLEEFGCAFLFEIMGDLQTVKNINRNTNKFRNYAENGYLLGRDWFILSSDDNYMPNIDRMKMHLIGIVNAIASECVVEIVF